MSINWRTAGVMVGVDGSAESDAAIRWAAREAVLRHAPLTLVHVVAPVAARWPMEPMFANITEWQQDNARHVLEQGLKTAHACIGDNEMTGIADVHTETLNASVVPALVSASENQRMVVVGSRGTGALGRMLLGSVSTGLVHHAHCPVAVIRPEAEGVDASAPVLLGVDGSPASEPATTMAFEEASFRGVSLVALHAWSDVAVFPILGMDWTQYEDQGHEILAERLAGWQERYPDVHVERRLVCDQPARWLIRESEDAQLVVVGSRGRGGFSSTWFGSVGSAVAQSANVPVLVVRGTPPGSK
ncbi:universal stress protein [Mycobacterium antarcticum]|uniref:universal stress protein n=1 Tax=Mycolicibacterium sp. TUM20984 TaxID=3023368 RepID=UPI0024E065E4|nr:universal stress protein [Mycolicibacterium sp. TUM20984]